MGRDLQFYLLNYVWALFMLVCWIFTSGVLEFSFKSSSITLFIPYFDCIWVSQPVIMHVTVIKIWRKKIDTDIKYEEYTNTICFTTLHNVNIWTTYQNYWFVHIMRLIAVIACNQSWLQIIRPLLVALTWTVEAMANIEEVLSHVHHDL